MDSHITWKYQIADHNSRMTWVYNRYMFLIITFFLCFFDMISSNPIKSGQFPAPVPSFDLKGISPANGSPAML